MKIIGIRPAGFTAKDSGEYITGQNIFVTEPLSKGTGCSSERLFISDARLNQCGYIPSVGDEVEIGYNRYGKVASIRKVK